MPFGTKADETTPSTSAPSPAAAAGSGGTGAGKEQRVTKQRLAISAALDHLDDFVSTQELYRILQNQGVSVSLATAYRILQ
jgi:Fur family transcriptional regulator, ferric uptake regulator